MRLNSSPIIVGLVLGALVAGCGTSDSNDSTDRTSKNTNSLSSTPAPSKSATAGPLAVVGVARNDKLNVRNAPNPAARVVARLAPTTTGITDSGKRAGQWRRITTAKGTGWAHGRFLAALGKPVDITTEGVDVGIAPTRRDLVRKVVRSQVEMGDGELAGPVTVAHKSGQFTVDVLGYADDAIAGERFIIRTFPGEAGFQVRSATATPICARSVTRDGLCG